MKNYLQFILITESIFVLIPHPLLLHFECELTGV